MSRPRHLGTIAAITAMTGLPAVAFAEGKLPQMDFANPYTFGQVVWMAVIMLALYFSMSRWALPAVGGIIEDRRTRIAEDLKVAQAAKEQAERAVSELNRAIIMAREASQAQIAKAIGEAKEESRREAEVLNARLAADLATAEAAIDAARQTALVALPAVAEDVAASLVQRLTGAAPDRRMLTDALEAARH